MITRRGFLKACGFVPATLLENAREILDAPVSDEELIAQAEVEPLPDSESEDSD